jgi:cell division protein FtsI (penicillin-binding protein 3)
LLVRLADPRKRLRVAMVVVCVLVSMFAGRLVQLQGVDASGYEQLATITDLNNVDLPAERGAIVDRNGDVLVQSVDAYHVIVDQQKVAEDGNAAAYALQLEGILDRDAADIQRTLTGDKRYQYLAKKVSPSTWAQIRDLELTGIYEEPVSERLYPSGPVAGNVIGFVGADGVGLGGLELSMQEQLAGVDGVMSYQSTPSANIRIPLGAGSRDDPVAGEGLQLTIDRDLQWYAEQAIAAAVDNARAAGGNVVIQDTRTGEILAMATAPVVDPANPGAIDAADRGNRVVEEVYEPGSVFKPITMAVVVEEGMAGPATVLTVPDKLTRNGETIRDYYNHPADQMTLSGIVAKSSNVGAALAAELVDAETYGEYLRRFGFGATLDLGLPAEAGGSLPDWTGFGRDYAAFGQGISVNTVQMASAYATIANDGVRMPPKLVSATVDSNGGETPVPGGVPERVISADAAAAVTTMMEAVMGPDGTGNRSKIDGYRVAGKTGTAQRIDPECGCYRDFNASFFGFAPADEPRFSVAVSLLDPKNGNSGGTLAGPVFADVMEFTLHKMGVAPSASDPPEPALFAD